MTAPPEHEEDFDLNDVGKLVSIIQFPLYYLWVKKGFEQKRAKNCDTYGLGTSD